MVITVPRLVIQHKGTAIPVAVVKPQPQPGEDPVWGTYSSHMFRVWAKHQTHMYQVWHTNLLQGKQYPQANAGNTQGLGPKGREEWGNIQLPVWSH